MPIINLHRDLLSAESHMNSNPMIVYVVIFTVSFLVMPHVDFLRPACHACATLSFKGRRA